MSILEVNNLNVKVGEKLILKNISLELSENNNYVMFGPNGSGKTTLINSIMGLPQYEVLSGKIRFRGNDITNKSVEERSKLGLALAFQHPPEIDGIKISTLLKFCSGKSADQDFNKKEKQLINDFNLEAFLNRDVNVGFSGGERKRAEILQMLLLRPKLILLDEPDSGVDVESLRLIGKQIQKYITETGSTSLIVTHKGDILDYVNAKYACVLLESSVYCFANPKRIYEKIKKSGYDECVTCQERVAEDWKND